MHSILQDNKYDTARLGRRTSVNGGMVTPVSILLVEGNPIFMRIVMLLLQKHYRHEIVVVGVAGGSEDALTQARELRPNVILLDLGMPGLNSIEMIPRLRSILPQVVIIALGLLDTNGLRQAALASGADDFIPKASLNTDLMPAIGRAAHGG